LPTYFKISNSPPLPEEMGIALDAPRIVVLKAGEKAIVAGSFRVRVRAQQLTARKDMAGYPPVASRTPTAIVPLTVLALSSASSEPLQMVLPMQLPSFDPVAADQADATVTGYFAFDLLAQKGIRPEAHTYFIYAFSGEHMFGPVSIGFVTESMLPGRR
jgi:hypothetical protein